MKYALFFLLVSISYLPLSATHIVGILNETYLEFVPLNSTDHFKAKADIKIYPNPAGDYLNVSLPRLSPCHFKIVDVRGAVIVPDQALQESGTIDLSHLSNGVYWIVIEFEHQIVTKKIVCTP